MTVGSEGSSYWKSERKPSRVKWCSAVAKTRIWFCVPQSWISSRHPYFNYFLWEIYFTRMTHMRRKWSLIFYMQADCVVPIKPQTYTSCTDPPTDVVDLWRVYLSLLRSKQINPPTDAVTNVWVNFTIFSVLRLQFSIWKTTSLRRDNYIKELHKTPCICG